MLLAINANNTNVKFGLFEGERMVGDWRIRTESSRTSDEYMVWLSQLLALAGIDRRLITGDHYRHRGAPGPVPSAHVLRAPSERPAAGHRRAGGGARHPCADGQAQ